MKRLAHCLSLFLLLLIALPALCDEQQKAQKLLNKVTAMATDPNGRRAVSLAVSEALSVGRPTLAQLRQLMNISYGDLFLAYQLGKSGVNLDAIGAQMKSGKKVWQIAREHDTDWKQLAADARKLNVGIDENLLRHFSGQRAEAERNKADGYNPFLDSVKADNSVGPEEITDAQKRYEFLRDHAGYPTGGRLDEVTQMAFQAARPDPIRNGGPSNPDTNTRPGPK
jgi:hypothetical protein